MIYIVLNAATILAATIVSLAFGALFYGMVGAGQRRGGTVVTALLAEFWLGAILAGALILAPAKAGVWTMTLGSAFIIWVGFVMPVIIATYRLRGLSWRMAGLDSTHWLGAMLIQAVVMRVIGLIPPPA
jgi:hypothetical protein